MPVLPLVGSTTMLEEFNFPSSSAARIIDTAMRSLTLPVGLKYSSLAAISASSPCVRLRKRTNGVLPISEVTSSKIPRVRWGIFIPL